MSEGRDPAIKLFGTEIPLPEEKMLAEEGDAVGLASAIELPLEGEKETPSSSGLKNSTEFGKKTSPETSKSPEEPNPENYQKEANTSGEDKALKKPDKVLPCPRCDSMDTKFCYYNNYNVNQPRHFCKNCQRYWTAGGMMRNVPVGAGRRKNKHSASSHRHAVVAPDPLPLVQMEGPDAATSTPKKSLKGNSTILKFGPDAPLCDSIASMLNLAEEKIEYREEPPCTSSVAVSISEENGLPPPPPSHWHSSWNPGGISGQQNFLPRSPIITVPAFCAPTFPFPFMPAPFWGWSCGQWNLPWPGNSNDLSSLPSSAGTGSFSVNCSPTLGKHSRDAERSLWIPKTLRIDDPDEAAKSSIFATLGIKFDECGQFKAFESNTGRDAVKLLRSNPAALSRSQSFQEIA